MDHRVLILMSFDSWEPTASIEQLAQRATLMQEIRNFFQTRGVLEVETPLLCHATITDPYIQSLQSLVNYRGNKSTPMYLQTSPEYAMKRLLAAGAGPIFQICKAFRDEELGRLHNPEFTMLEWYRPGMGHFALMDEVDTLLQTILACSAAEKISYVDGFKRELDLDPLMATDAELLNCLQANQVDVPEDFADQRTVLLQLLMDACIEPNIGQDRPTMIYHFPAEQAALSKISSVDPRVAERFEVYYKGFELANGFHELTDANEQRQRFEKNLQQRKEAGVDTPKLDERFLAALSHGIPDCAGVALGVDRLMMLALDTDRISDVLAFSVENA